MEFLALDGSLEIRARGDGRVLSGSFPYGKTATVKDRGRVRKERVAPRAFSWQLERFKKLQEEAAQVIEETIDQARKELLQEQLERANVHVLSGHEYSKPLGDMLRGAARVVDSDDALRFEVDLPDERDMPSYMLDVVKEIRTGRAGGLSPGFRIPPRNVVPDAEELIGEVGNPGVQVRVIKQAVLHEMSIVTRPSYASTEIDVRDDDPLLVNPRRRRWL